MEITFEGKRVLVTGAASGIGRGIATELVKLSATVIALDVSKELLENLHEELPSVETVVGDISDWEKIESVVQSVFPIDLLVNNAGLAAIGPISGVSESTFDGMFNVNVKGLFRITQTVVEHLIARNYPGSIVNISSQASQAGLLNHTVYCATKGAVDAFTRSLALEVGLNNIRVNSVNPTVVLTELGRRVWADPELRKPMLAKIPLQRFAEIKDVVDVVIFLLSDKARMINGHCLPVDGGFLAC